MPIYKEGLTMKNDDVELVYHANDPLKICGKVVESFYWCGQLKLKVLMPDGSFVKDWKHLFRKKNAMKVYAVIEVTYGYYEFEQFVGVAKTLDGALSVAAKYLCGMNWEIVMESEPAKNEVFQNRHAELAESGKPHILIFDTELYEE